MGALWVDDDSFDLSRHVLQEKLPRKKGQSQREALQARAGELATTPLDPDRPLWQFHLVDHYEGGSALIARVHHCIGDGIALISVMMSITDGGTDPPARRRREPEAEAEAEAEEHDWLSDAVLKPLTDLTVKAIGMYGGGCGQVDADAGQRTSGSLCWARWTMARMGYQVVSDVAALAVMPDDARTSLKGKPVGRKCVAWSEPMPLDTVKAVGKALGCSINDVLLACAGRRHRPVPARARRRPDRPGDPRHGAGEPAALVRGLEARQPLWPGAAGAAHRHREPGGARSTPCGGA